MQTVSDPQVYRVYLAAHRNKQFQVMGYHPATKGVIYCHNSGPDSLILGMGGRKKSWGPDTTCSGRAFQILVCLLIHVCALILVLLLALMIALVLSIRRRIG